MSEDEGEVPIQNYYVWGQVVHRSPHDYPTPPGGCTCAYCRPPPPPPPPPPPAADAPKAMRVKGKFAKKVGAAMKAMKA